MHNQEIQTLLWTLFSVCLQKLRTNVSGDSNPPPTPVAGGNTVPGSIIPAKFQWYHSKSVFRYCTSSQEIRAWLLGWHSVTHDSHHSRNCFNCEKMFSEL